MIDIENAKQKFEQYVKKYISNNPKVELKIYHTFRTVEVSKRLATDLKLDEENIELAQLIALLHDIGRFEQIKQYNTFSDRESINHGEYAVKILFEDNLIRDFIHDNKYDEIIKKAVLNHNRDKIEEGLNENELLHSKIIRDADKVDIFYLLAYRDIENIYSIEEISNSDISAEIQKEFFELHKLNYKDLTTPADRIVSHYCLVFDFYFDFSIKEIAKNEYIEIYFNRIEFKNERTRNIIQQMKKEVDKYIKDRISK